MQPYDDSLVLDRLLGQMDLAFTNITGQTISFIDHRGRWHGPLRLERFTDFCRCVMDSPEGGPDAGPATTLWGCAPAEAGRWSAATWG